MKRGIQDQAYLESQTENLEKLYKIFEVEPVKEIIFHDGVSPIHIPEQSENEVFQWCWEYLVLPSGKAQTAQREVIRIAGRVNNEIMGNGGANWDSDYRKMLRIFPEYFRLGNPLKDEDIVQAEKITMFLQDGGDNGDYTMSLCAYAAAWILKNPEVLPPLEADYSR